MNGKRNRSSRSFSRWTATAVLWLAGAGSALFAQNPVVPVVNTTTATKTSATLADPATDSGVVPAGCSSCSRGLLGPDVSALPTFGGGGCGDGCCGGQCVPGRTPCDCCIDESTCCGRLLGGLYHCICCPDPCYEPKWNALADAAFFQDGARPVTQMRLRYEGVADFTFPDKAEFLWRQEHTANGGSGPKTNGLSAVSYQDLSYYQEVAIDRFSTWISVPYVYLEARDSFAGASGFGDITIGTKSLLVDCELMQLSFAFNTYILSGNFLNGEGTGHVSLEPGLLSSLKLSPTTYLQAAMLYRIPIAGDSGFEGPVLQYHLSLNHTFWECGSCNGIKLIGVCELNGYEIFGGEYTAPGGAVLSARDIGNIVSIGPGVRLVICDKIDFGVGSAFNITHDSMGDEIVRADFRWRF